MVEIMMAPRATSLQLPSQASPHSGPAGFVQLPLRIKTPRTGVIIPQGNRLNLVPLPARMENKLFKTGKVSSPMTRNIKTAPVVRTNSRRPRSGKSHPSTPQIRPFSEQSNAPESPINKRSRYLYSESAPRTRRSNNLSDIYSWARPAERDLVTESLNGMELTAGILSYKPARPQTSDYEGSLKAGFGYEGYMDCLLRGRRKHINKKASIQSTATITVALVPSNSLVIEET